MSWEAFKPFLSRYQWAFDDPANSPRSVEIASAIKNRGQKGCCTFVRENGARIILRPMRGWAFEQAIEQRRKIYYVSYGQYALLYLDIDLHHAWQTPEDGERARQFLEKLFAAFLGRPGVFWINSSRGINGYLKVNLSSHRFDHANEVFARLEKALRRFLALYKILADFEVKGRFGYLGDDEYVWKQYGKLPIHHPEWNLDRLEQFRQKPLVPLNMLVRLCEALEQRISSDVLECHNAYKRNLGEAPLVKDNYFLVTPTMERGLREKLGDGWDLAFNDARVYCDGALWLSMKYFRPGQLPATEKELRSTPPAKPGALVHPTAQTDSVVLPAPLRGTSPTSSPPTPARKRPQVGRNLDVDDLKVEPDSFERQRNALLQLARSLKRVPDLNEALDFIRESRLYTGTWDENFSRRQTRVQSILTFITRSFDASKCTKGSVNVGKFDSWVLKKFPKGLTGGRRKSLTPEGTVVEVGETVRVSPAFISTFLSVCEFALVIDKNKDGTLPHARAEKVWDSLYARGLIRVRFCARKWAICRDQMDQHGIVRITDREYGPGQAMKWDVGPYFPFQGLWKKPERPVIAGAGPGGTGPGDCKSCDSDRIRLLRLTVFREDVGGGAQSSGWDGVREGRETQQDRHNTWLQMQPRFLPVVAVPEPARPPPT